MSRISRAAAQMLITRTSSAPATLTPEQQALVEALMTRHGDIRLAREVNGVHAYITCPECLQEDGEPETWKKHLAINLDRWAQGHNRAAQCMKTGQVFEIDALTMWEPLEKRGYSTGPPKIRDQLLIREDYLETDEHGNTVPKGPGLTVPLTGLPEDHPCIYYLRSRNFDPAALEAQFAACYCYEDRKDLKYRKLTGGFIDSPGGRLVLYILQNGVRVGWQARILDVQDEQAHYYYHPGRQAWLTIETRETPECPWVRREGWEEFEPSKYLSARGMRRNSCVMGYDAAMKWNRLYRAGKKRFVIVSEGPLDSARLGSPAVAICGKVASEKQCEMLSEAFDVLLVCPDNDIAGSKLMPYIGQWVGAMRPVYEIKVPARFKDAGEMSAADAAVFRVSTLAPLGLL